MLMELQIRKSSWKDYFSLSKPRVVLLHLMTAAAAMVLAAGGVPPVFLLVSTLAGGALVAGASNTLNCYFDRDIDKIMVRTHNRPLPGGRISPSQALLFSGIIALAGLFILSRFVNWAAASLALSAMAYYIVVYTLWLKRRTYWSAIAGSGAGAFPPLIGWIAVTGRVETTPFILFLIIALWTMPHYWSLAIYRRHDYGTAGLNVIPYRNPGRWITIFSFLLVLTSFLLIKVAHLGQLYSVLALLLGLVLIILTTRLQIRESPQTARILYLYSIIYLLVLFGSILTDRLVLL